MMSGPLRTVLVGLPDNYWMSPLRGNIAQDHKRVTATKFWESDKLRDNKRIQADA